MDEADGKRNLAFNLKLKEQLHQLVFEINKADIQKQKRILEKKPTLFTKIFLFIPAVYRMACTCPALYSNKKFYL